MRFQGSCASRTIGSAAERNLWNMWNPWKFWNPVLASGAINARPAEIERALRSGSRQRHPHFIRDDLVDADVTRSRRHQIDERIGPRGRGQRDRSRLDD